jgi:hypothetical protein
LGRILRPHLYIFLLLDYDVQLLDYKRPGVGTAREGVGLTFFAAFSLPPALCERSQSCATSQRDVRGRNAKSRPSKILAKHRDFRQEHRHHRRLSDPVPANRRGWSWSAEFKVYVEKGC